MTYVVHLSGFNGGNGKVLSLAISHTVQSCSARSRPSSYIFLVYKVNKVTFDRSRSRTLFGTRQKFDKHGTLSRFRKWKKSSLIILCFELYTTRSRYIAHFFTFWDWKSSSLINLYLVLYSARTWIATNISSYLGFSKISRSVMNVISVFCKRSKFNNSCNFLT